ncbi:MAG: anhydro-N-acetylmuramic acid kinase [bacterium]|nr:anhydro-N-acetylmuramic acid kinase [bacterium]
MIAVAPHTLYSRLQRLESSESVFAMYIIGLMSGTSADGIDAALCRMDDSPVDGLLQADILHAITVPYPLDFQMRILNAARAGRVDELCALNVMLGELFAAAAHRVIADSGFSSYSVDLIGSHGQTFWHAVEADGRVSGTLQLGSAAVIAERTGITTISNFRARDAAAGGQGAPLTGYADWLLLRHPTLWRAAQNIGGIGNVTLLPPLTDTITPPIAFDTGPGNALIDSAISLVTQGAQSYDRDGRIALSGTVDQAWLGVLLAHPYYALQPPKSTGRELFSAGMAAALLAEGRGRGLADADVIAVLTALTAHTIADAYTRFASVPPGEVIVSGGGRHNPLIMTLLRTLIPARVLTSDEVGIDGDNKEALVFALLAYQTWHGRTGNLPSLTGAAHPAILGDITPGARYANLIRRTWCASGS